MTFREDLRHIMSDWVGRALLVGVSAILLVTIASVIGVVVEQRRWEQFKTDHNCKLVGVVESDAMPGYGLTSDGKIAFTISQTPKKEGWLCDDGITYWR